MTALEQDTKPVAPICDWSDLPATQCAHCTGAALEDPISLVLEGTWCEARHPGRCAHCGEHFPEGTEIAKTEIGWCHVECTRQAGTGHC